MNIHKYFKVFVCALFLLGACKDEEVVVHESFIDGVQKLRATSRTSGVSLSWENPTNQEYDQVEVSYTLNGEERKISKDADEQYSVVDIELPDADVYKFVVRAFSSTSQKSAIDVSVKGRKLAPLAPEDELLNILNSVDIQGGDGGVRIFWENPSDVQATVRLEYEEQVWNVDADGLLKEYSLSGLELNKVYSFDVSIVYEGEVSTIVKTFAVMTAPAYHKLVNVADWSITASNTGSGLSPFDLLDDNPNTFWRSADKITAATPQYVIVDFKQIRYIAALTFVRKWGDGENSSWDINISTSEDGVSYTYPYMYKNASTDPRFVREFNRTIDGEQIYVLPQTHRARYVRIDFVRGSAYAVFGDINFYGE